MAAEPRERPPRPRPGITRDTEHFWKGLEEGKLLLQKCRSCSEIRFPPEPMCPHCMCLEWDPLPSKGRGTVYSFVVVHFPKIPAFEYPNPVVLVELDEGVRIVSNVIGIPKDDIKIGMKVQAEFVKTDPELTLHQFRPVKD